MKNVLILKTSILGEGSVSNQLIGETLARLEQAGETLNVVERDFATVAVPHLDAEWLAAIGTDKADRTPEQHAKADFSDSLIAELQAADIVVIGMPMYNFTVPSMLKAWVDHVARAGVTFTYTESGPRGLLKEKTALLVSAMGGVHQVGETDFLRPYMKQIMAFLGIEDVHFVTANGLNMGPTRRESGLQDAQGEIDNLIAAAGPAAGKQEVAA